VFERDGILLAVSEYAGPTDVETASVEWVRYRTVGDLTITGAVRSRAVDIEKVIEEISAATVSERGETRADDRTSAAGKASNASRRECGTELSKLAKATLVRLVERGVELSPRRSAAAVSKGSGGLNFPRARTLR